MIKALRIEKLAYKGYGLGFKDSNPIFVPYTVPGDLVDVEIIKETKNVVFARIDKFIEHSESRRKAPCDVFGKCGGCNWLNINYEKQLEYKAEIVNEIFRNIDLPDQIELQASPEEFHYRNKCFYPIQKNNDEINIGLYAAGSHDVIPHSSCKLQPEFYNRIVHTFHSYLKASRAKIYDEKTGKGNIRHLGIRYSFSEDEIVVIVVTKNHRLPFSKQLIRVMLDAFPNISGIVQNINSHQTNVILGSESKLIYGRNYLSEKIGDKKFRFEYDSFFQINRDLTEKMYSFIKENIEQDSAVIDAYCGVGSIGIFCKEKIAELKGFEINHHAVENARINAKNNDLQNVEFYKEDLANSQTYKGDVLICDPPRKGLSREFLKGIPTSVKKMIYVSCEPNTQLRDLNILFHKGFRIDKMKAFDMFPQTYHIENVCILER